MRFGSHFLNAHLEYHSIFSYASLVCEFLKYFHIQELLEIQLCSSSGCLISNSFVKILHLYGVCQIKALAASLQKIEIVNSSPGGNTEIETVNSSSDLTFPKGPVFFPAPALTPAVKMEGDCRTFLRRTLKMQNFHSAVLSRARSENVRFPYIRFSYI